MHVLHFMLAAKGIKDIDPRIFVGAWPVLGRVPKPCRILLDSTKLEPQTVVCTTHLVCCQLYHKITS